MDESGNKPPNRRAARDRPIRHDRDFSGRRPERRNPRQKQRPRHWKPKASAADELFKLWRALLPEIKGHLEGIVHSHERLIVARDRRAQAEKRKTDALDRMAECLKGLLF